MAEQLSKLRPDRDLQCYFQQPSTVAALSETSANAFTLSGCWRQAFDWAVLEWNRDNVFEHPALRNLPDGDLSGIQLSYEEARTNSIPIDSTTYDFVDWPYLRIWEQHREGTEDVERFHRVRLKDYATPMEGAYVAATAELELTGTPTAGDLIELAWLEDHCNYQLAPGDTLQSALAALAGFINGKQADGCVVTASAVGSRIRLTYTGAPGSNGNRVGVYGGVTGAMTESWSPSATRFSGGASPQKWRVDLDFNNLTDTDHQLVDTRNVRKLRWTWAADLQSGDFQRSEFSVVVTNWLVSGTNTGYQVAGRGSRRIEDDSSEVQFAGTWVEKRGNYSGGSIRYSTTAGDSLRCTYAVGWAHYLYLGTRYLSPAPKVMLQVDSNLPIQVDLNQDGDDVLIRVPLGQFAANQSHTVTVTHAGSGGEKLYFDFLEIAVRSADLPDFEASSATTLATDWDTNHSLAIAPERTAWLIQKLGFRGRANHYVGAMWFYELWSPGNRYASATVQFAGTPHFLDNTQITIAGTAIQHINLTTDTPESVAKCFELLISAGSSAVWAHADGATLTIVSRTMGAAGDGIAIAASNSGAGFTATAGTPTLSGGAGPSADIDAAWRTDLNALPRINRAVRDWSRSFYRALKGYGIDVAAAFSTELRHGDDSVAVGIAQQYPGGPVWVNTPALQTNFSPASAAFWKQIYSDMAGVMTEAGVTPYLQFGEVQWWYKPDDGTGMPFYDDYTKSKFLAEFGRPLALILSQNADPASFPSECAFLPTLIGSFTDEIMQFVRSQYPQTRFEVLYPMDVNDTPLNRIINYPSAWWTPAKLDCLKTENFIYTGNRDLNKCRESIAKPMELGFPRSKSSHLIGIGDPTTPWQRERQDALGDGIESIVLFALDQFCLVGYGVPLGQRHRRGRFMGK